MPSPANRSSASTNGDAGSRVFAHHTWSNAGWRRPYFDVLRLFSVDGPVLEPSAWKFQRAIFEPSDDLEEQLEQHQVGLSAVEQGTEGRFRWGGSHVVTYLPSDARVFEFEVRTPPSATLPKTLTIRIDGEVAARRELVGDSWLTLQQPLTPRAQGTDPYCIELLVDPPWRGADRGAMYRAFQWKR